jgi:hypothetical protein
MLSNPLNSSLSPLPRSDPQQAYSSITTSPQPLYYASIASEPAHSSADYDSALTDPSHAFYALSPGGAAQYDDSSHYYTGTLSEAPAFFAVGSTRAFTDTGVDVGAGAGAGAGAGVHVGAGAGAGAGAGVDVGAGVGMFEGPQNDESAL